MSVHYIRPFVVRLLEHLTINPGQNTEELADSLLKLFPVGQFLKHKRLPLSNGGQVVLLDTGAIINPEAVAMLQAMYSRDPKSVMVHLEHVMIRGAEHFMKTFYVEYGHKSIADCATATFFIEGVSMLACKAIQDTMLYAGQEASTRYIDFRASPFIDPLAEMSGATELLSLYRAFYIDALPALVDHFTLRFPKEEGWNEIHYNKAIKARAFDVVRGFLPAGAQSSAAWHADLRLVADRLPLLRNHALAEVREIAVVLEKLCLETFPSSFGHKVYEEAERYHALTMNGSYYFEPRGNSWHTDEVRLDSSISLLDLDELVNIEQEDGSHVNILAVRPQYSEVPKWLATCGTMESSFLLDYGSFRDIQRHRAVVQRMPLLTINFGFEQWYLNELPDSVRERALALLSSAESFVLAAVTENRNNRFAAQYYIPMGYLVPCHMGGDLPAMTYLVERRARADVHPTLRSRTYKLADLMYEEFSPSGLTIYVDPNPDEFSLKRGKQDIVRLDTK